MPASRTTFLAASYRELRLLETATGQQLKSILTEQKVSMDALAFSPDSRLAVSGGEDGSVKIWDLEAGRELQSLDLGGGLVWTTAFSPDGRFVLAAGGQDNARQLKVWEVTGKEIGRFALPPTAAGEVEFTSDSRFVLFRASEGGFHVAEAATGKVLRHIGKEWMTKNLVLSADGRSALGLDLNRLRLWDIASGKEPVQFNGHGNDLVIVHAGAFSPDGRLAASGASDTTVKLWDTATGKRLHTLSGHTDEVRSVAFSPDGGFVISGSEDGTARLWEVSTGREVAMLVGGMTEWVTLTPEGFFSSSHRDTEMLAISRELETSTIGQIHQSLFNPDLVREALASDPNGDVKSAAEVVNIDKVLDAAPLPTSPSSRPRRGAA